MSRRTSFLTAAVITAMVVVGSTPVQAANGNAVKRAIVITVLNNLGVQPTSELVDTLVNDIPMDVLDAGLVRQVGKALDSNGDAAQVIGQTVDSNGDGVPDENGATSASSADDEGSEDEESSESNSNSNSGSSSSSTGGGTNTRPPNNDEEEAEEEEEEEPEEEEPEEEEDGDDEDN
jgi:U3 small nucleolar ribonucleoprotein component